MDLRRIKRSLQIRGTKKGKQDEQPRSELRIGVETGQNQSGRPPGLRSNSSISNFRNKYILRQTSAVESEVEYSDVPTSLEPAGDLSSSSTVATRSGIEIIESGSAPNENSPTQMDSSLRWYRNQKRQLPDHQRSGREHERPTEPYSETPQEKTKPAASHLKTFYLEDNDDFDLRPPQLKAEPEHQNLNQLVLSRAHLSVMLSRPLLLNQFRHFLKSYEPQLEQALTAYLAACKAIKAWNYAESLTQAVASYAKDKPNPASESRLEQGKELNSILDSAASVLTNVGLPAFVTRVLMNSTHSILVKVSMMPSNSRTDTEISGLTEVFCITDPRQQGNPIVYVSDAFHRITGYSRQFVIGRNCRFLQGTGTSEDAVQRLSIAIRSGEAINETVLNYRRDGESFLNLLMMAPLHDNNRAIRYIIGAQIDVTALVKEREFQDLRDSLEAGKSSLVSEVASNHLAEISAEDDVSTKVRQKALKDLGELSALFDVEDNLVIKETRRGKSTSGSRPYGTPATKGVSMSPSPQHPVASRPSRSQQDTEEKEQKKWSLSQFGNSGVLPGAYQLYLLVRPHPSYLIVFVSPSLQDRGKLIQSHLMAHVHAPGVTTAHLRNSFESGKAVRAHIAFMFEPDAESAYQRAQPFWISATPLFGSDDKIGVWVVVMIERPSARPASSIQPKSPSSPVASGQELKAKKILPPIPDEHDSQVRHSLDQKSLWKAFPPPRTSSRTSMHDVPKE